MFRDFLRSGFPGRISSDHRVEDGEQFSHAGGERHFGRFSGLSQAVVEATHYGVAAERRQDGHVKG